MDQFIVIFVSLVCAGASTLFVGIVIGIATFLATR